MGKEKMLVTKALNELKLLDARIVRGINDGGFVTAAKTAETKVTPGVTKKEYSDSAISSYQSVLDLIERRSKIKSAIVSSNATTEVEIASEKMTVAEAIERKTSIDYEVKLLRTLQRQLNDAKSTAVSQNVALEVRIDKYIEAMLGKDAKNKKEDLAEMITPIRTANEYSLVDPLDIEKKITLLSEKIENFKSEVDSVLQVANCVTWIEF